MLQIPQSFGTADPLMMNHGVQVPARCMCSTLFWMLLFLPQRRFVLPLLKNATNFWISETATYRSVILFSSLNEVSRSIPEYEFHTDGFKMQADFYLNQLKNRIQGMPGMFEGRPAVISTNIGEARLYGYEISSEKTLTTWSVLKAWLAYVRGEDTHYKTSLPQIAPLTGQVELDGYFKNVGTLSFSCSGSAAQNNLAAGEKHTAGYIVYDFGFVSVPLTAGQFSFIIRTGIQNLFNMDYQNHLSTLRGIIKDEPGRNIFLNATMAF